MLEEHEHLFYIETSFPQGLAPGDQVPGPVSFGRYRRLAYTDVADPGRYKWLHESRPDAFTGLLDRIGQRAVESLIFRNADQALTAAACLRDLGRLSCGWEDDSPRALRRREEPLEVRVVEEITSKMVRLVKES